VAVLGAVALAAFGRTEDEAVDDDDVVLLDDGIVACGCGCGCLDNPAIRDKSFPLIVLPVLVLPVPAVVLLLPLL